MSSVSDAEVIPDSESAQGHDANHIPGSHEEDDVPISNTFKAKQLKHHAAEEMERMIDRINCASDGDNDANDAQMDESYADASEQPVLPLAESMPVETVAQGVLEEPAPVTNHGHDAQDQGAEASPTKKVVSYGKNHRVKVSSDSKIKKRSSVTQKQTKKVTSAETKVGRPRQASVRKKVVVPNKAANKSPGKKKDDGQAPSRPISKAATEKTAKPSKTSTKGRPEAAAATSKVKSSQQVELKKSIDKQNRNSRKSGITKNSPSRSSVSAAKTKKGSPGSGTKTAGRGKKIGELKADNKRKRANGKSGADDDETGGTDNEVVESEGDDVEGQEETQDSGAYVMQTPTKGGILGNLACSSRDGNTRALLDHAVQQLGKYCVVDYTGDVDMPLRAYIIGKGTRRGWGLLRAVASGVALVSEDWLSTSISDGAWADIDTFRSDRFGQSPRGIDTTAGTNNILNGMRVKVECPDDSAKVRKLIMVCGGRVAETRMDIVINDGQPVVNGVVNVDKKWLADSIEAGAALDLDAYNITSST